MPEGLKVTALEGGNGVLEVTALSLRSGPELYVALRNTGEVPACSAAVSVELFDGAAQSLAAGISGLLTQHFYRLTDGSGAIAACVGPGDVTMAALTDLPADLSIDSVTDIVYRCPYFALDVEPIDGLAIGPLKTRTDGAATQHTGTLVNRLDVPVSRPSVTVFAVNRAGRPFAAATASSNVEIPPQGSWAFEVHTEGASGADYLAYPAGALGPTAAARR